MAKSGSAFLILLFVLSSVVLLCTVSWHYTALYVALAAEKQHSEQYQQCNQGLAHYAMALFKKNYDHIFSYLSENKELIISIPEWPPSNKECQGAIVFEKKDTIISCKTSFIKKRYELHTIQFELAQEYDSSDQAQALIIQNWHVV